MSAQLKTHLAVHGGGRTMIEKWLIGKRTFNFKFTVMREPDLQRIIFFRILKLLSGIIYLIFVSLFHFRTMFFFVEKMFSFCRRENRPEKHSGTSLFLVKILKTFPYNWRMTSRFNWFHQPILVRIRGDFCFQDGKSCLSTLHYAIFLLLQRSFSIPSLLFPANSEWIYSLKGLNKFNFLRSLLQIRCS